ncbi:Flagellar protein FliS [Thalassovita gelatinovora]|uniref:Flagellar protein FliS n=1 Tax=Thalassovita gelatinovora TaxID=53501 RepID=A0A0P1FKQ9_THAGE|nr:flagellar protein FliS [Thalassovita gelatinovora]QIZ78983.1 flagellar protein FliS [Thalassovita gelatinovora]CUH68511.1 Flagellar protein FliS [Thalassovita gelatinovora]SEQ53806.1 flagellar protein FliS [Thalassovita gelatinovora]
MTFALARSKYRQTGNSGMTVPDDPYQIIRVILRELEQSLNVLKAAEETGTGYPQDHVNKSLRAIYLLQSSLDFEQGGDIAVSLFELYEYCRQNVLSAFRREEGAQIDQAADAISGILDAWTEIGPEIGRHAG